MTTRRAIVAVAVFAFALFTYPGATAVSLATRVVPFSDSSAQPGDLPWLHVAHPAGARPFIADERGRMVLLHGTTPASLVDFGPGVVQPYPIDPSAYADGRCPANTASSRYPPLCQSDLVAMAAMGFNVVRLPISWSLLEPERGRFSQPYLDRITQVVEWARALRMHVIIDMHQNAYSHYVGASAKPIHPVNLAYNSGAPKWATFTDGLPSTLLIENQRELNPAVFEATTNFWYDRDGIQDEYIAAIAFVARRFKNDSVVAGYGVYNEPWIGWNLPPGFEDLLLFPFYRRVIDAITGAHDGLPCWSGFFMPAPCGYRDLGVDDRRHLFFLDTGLPREVTDFPTHLGLPVSSYRNVVLALHAYTHIYTIDTLMQQKLEDATYPWGGYEQSYAFAEHEAGAMDAALFVEEFGNNPSDDHLILEAQVKEQERHRAGFAFWTWKENGGSGSWGMFDPPGKSSAASGCIRSARELLLARVYPAASPDPDASFGYDDQTGSFVMHGTAKAGAPPAVVYIPPEVKGPIAVSGTGPPDVQTLSNGVRILTATPAGGPFAIDVGPAPLAPSACDA